MVHHRKDISHVRQPRGLDRILLFKARFETLRYTKHTHPEFAIGLMEYGTAKCFYKGGTYDVPAGTIITLNPDELHTGEAPQIPGYRYRIAYIPQEIIREM